MPKDIGAGEVPDVPKAPHRPGDLILNRVMPNATNEEREAARENLRQFAEIVVRIAERITRDEKFDSP